MDITLATLAAAVIAAMVAIVVALVNGFFARQVAIDNAHRAYRAEFADSSVVATQAILANLFQLEDAAARKDVGRWREIVNELTNPRVKLDLRTPHDPVFAEAVKLFVHHRR